MLLANLADLVLVLFALPLSHFDGTTLCDKAHMPLDEMRCVKDAFLPLQKYGSSPDGLNRDSFVATEHRLVIIALEHVDETLPSRNSGRNHGA